MDMRVGGHTDVHVQLISDFKLFQLVTIWFCCTLKTDKFVSQVSTMRALCYRNIMRDNVVYACFEYS